MTAIIDGTNGVTTPNVLTSSSGVALTLQSNGGTTALTIATNQAITVANTGNGITYSSSAGSGLRMYGSAGTNQWDVYGNGANIRFSDNTGGGIVVVDTAARIGSTIGVGGTTPSSSGAGITFPATQSASSDANTLDDYEEGTFTPTMAPVSGSWNGASAKGFYTKVGNVVCLQMYLTITDVGTASSNITFGSLPFTAFNPSVGGGNRAAIGIVREDAITGNLWQFYINGTATTGGVQSLSGGTIGQANGYVYDFTVTYRTT